jgi:hypothetical protein
LDKRREYDQTFEVELKNLVKESLANHEDTFELLKKEYAKNLLGMRDIIAHVQEIIYEDLGAL